LALILWGRSLCPLVKVITAFTLAHSLTLCLAVLDIMVLSICGRSKSVSTNRVCSPSETRPALLQPPGAVRLQISEAAASEIVQSLGVLPFAHAKSVTLR
jgi:hypothetical protein